MSRFYQRTQDRIVESTTTSTTDSGAAGSSRIRKTLRVENQSYGINNGGASCVFTIPSYTRWMTIEAWGGGGEASGSACCTHTNGAGSGSYSQKTFYDPKGTLTICAGSSTPCCRYDCDCACNGFPSFVLLNGTQILCADGGIRSHNRMGLTNCYQCCAECLSPGNCVYPNDPTCLFISGAAGTSVHTQYCEQRRFGHMPTAPMTTSAWKATRQGCAGGYSGPCYGCAPLFPGGGGNQGKADGGSCCWSLWGAGGLVLITYGN